MLLTSYKDHSVTKQYYVYQHIRTDKNEPFYIGVGKMYKRCKSPVRAYNTQLKNKLWWYIANKTDYRVEIILQSDNYEEVRNKEIELIALYGRKDIGTGILSNMTNGGDGVKGMVNTAVAQLNRSRKGLHHPNRGRKRPDMASRKGAGHPMFGKSGKLHPKSRVFTDTITGNTYYGIKEAAAGMGISKSRLNRCVYAGVKNTTTLIWEKEKSFASITITTNILEK